MHFGLTSINVNLYLHHKNSYLFIDFGSTLIEMNKLQGSSPPGLPPTFQAETGPLWAGMARAVAQAFAGLAGDVALVIDESGVVLGAAQGDGRAGAGGTAGWEGRDWRDAVTPDCQAKAAMMLQELADRGVTRRREINFRLPGGQELTLACSALRLGEHGPSLVVGRDLAATAALQQRLLEAQQQLERGYWNARRRLENHDAG